MKSPLLEPMRFKNGVEAPNRLWLAPMTNLQSHADGSISEEEQRWLMRRAEGGFGVVETCAAHVAEDGQAWAGELGVFDDRLVDGLSGLARAVRGAGALGLVQLFHGGVRADPALTGVETWSASAVDDATAARPREASEADILGVIGRFRDAAVRVARAGFDGVELHGAHGYLLGQFLSRIQNVRTDGWGGAALEGRARLMREALRAVRAAVPAEFVVGIRISPEDWGQSRGLDLDENLRLVGWLADDGADFVHVSLWNAQRNTRTRPQVHPVPLFRAALPAGLPLVVAGSVWTKAEGEALLAMGADAVALGRSAIANPDWPRRIAEDGWEPRRPPLTHGELLERGLSEPFARYMRSWKGFVAEEG